MEQSNKKKLVELNRSDFFILLLDVIAVNLSYLMALYLRFFVAGEMNVKGIIYPELFWNIAPFYTIAAILVFMFCRLYGGMWKYAGINDVNRIITGNVIAAVLQVAISIIVLAFVPQQERHVSRMPLSYYILGALFQFGLVFLIRFSYKFIRQERENIAKKKTKNIPTLVIGSGDLGMKVVRHIGSSTEFRAVSIIGKDDGRMMDGIPVVPMDKIEEEIRRKEIKAVFVADKTLTPEEREKIRQAADGLELNDFTGYMSNLSGFLPLTNLLEVMETPITIQIGSETRSFSSAEECLSMLPDEYDVIRIQATKVVLKKRQQDDSWMKVYQEQTGQDVSYF